MRICLIIQDVKQGTIKPAYLNNRLPKPRQNIETLILSNNLPKPLKIRGFMDVDMKTSVLCVCFWKLFTVAESGKNVEPVLLTKHCSEKYKKKTIL